MQLAAFAVFMRQARQFKSCVHQQRARKALARLLNGINLIGVKSLKLQMQKGVFLLAHTNNSYKRFPFVLRNEGPCAVKCVVPRTDKTVKISAVNKIVVFVVFLNLFLYYAAVFFAELIRVKLISERSPKRNVALCTVACTLAGGNVRTH